ncbi:MAG: glycosyltransferase family 39 protein [Flavobacteriales bacterium]
MDWRTHIARFGRVTLPGERWMRITFLALLALAAVLRLWDLPHLPYTHDEISALVRIYPSLSETIQRGVIELDTHPPGVQVFEWVWTRLFSMHEPDVKLPFIVMSLAAIFLLYRFALAWTAAAPALLLTTLMATLQYSVMYGQIARPYAAGLFTTALFADQLTRYLAFGHRRALIGIGIAAVLSAYTHHFALLLVGLMGITGLLLVKREQRKAYLIMCGAVVLLYLPNVPIFLKQLGLGGLGEWLAPPGADWLSNYAWYIAHCSLPFAILLIIVVAVAMILHVRKAGDSGPATAVLLTWGLGPLIVGLAYSVWRAPVIQYSVVLFSFPYLALALISGLRSLGRQATIALCVLVAFTSVRTLISSRHHYDLLYTSKYETIIREGQRALADHGTDGAIVMIDAPDHVIRFYLDLWKVDGSTFPYAQLRDGTASRLDSLLVGAKGRVVAYGQSNGAQPENVARIQQYFPYLLKRRDLVDGQTFLLADKPGYLTWHDRDTLATLRPGTSLGAWEIQEDLTLVKDSAQLPMAWDYSGREFGLTTTLALDTVTQTPQELIEVVAHVEFLDELTDAAIIVDMKAGDSTVFYRGGDLHPHGKGPATLIVAVRPADPGPVVGPVVLKAYVYNRNKGGMYVKRIDVLRRTANPVVFGTLEPVPWLGRYR